MTEVKSREYLKSIQQVEEADLVIDELHFKEITTTVESLLSKVTPRQKEIFLLSREEGLSHKEIAQKLNISESTVNNHLVTTLKYLKSHIGKGLIVNILFACLFLS